MYSPDLETIGVRYIGNTNADKKSTYVVAKLNYTGNTATTYTIPTEWTAIAFGDLTNCKFFVFDSYIYWLKVVNSVTTEVFYKTEKSTTKLTEVGRRTIPSAEASKFKHVKLIE